jgi:hypothetical protein
MGMKGADDELDGGGGLSAAYRAEPDERFGGEVDSGMLVGVGAAEVIADGPALQDRDDRQTRVSVPQGEHAGDGAALMFGDAQAGPGGHGGFAHPVLGRGPGQVTDLIAVPADLGGIMPGGRTVIPGAVPGQFGESAGIQCPRRYRAGQGAVAAEPAIRNKQGDLGSAEPAGMMRAEEEDRASGVRPRARTVKGSGRESQHRAGGSGHGQLPFARVLAVSVTGAGVSPQRCWAPCRVMPSRSAMSAQE